MNSPPLTQTRSSTTYGRDQDTSWGPRKNLDGNTRLSTSYIGSGPFHTLRPPTHTVPLTERSPRVTPSRNEVVGSTDVTSISEEWREYRPEILFTVFKPSPEEGRDPSGWRTGVSVDGTFRTRSRMGTPHVLFRVKDTQYDFLSLPERTLHVRINLFLWKVSPTLFTFPKLSSPFSVEPTLNRIYRYLLDHFR